MPDIYPQGISPKRLEQQIIWLKRLGFAFVPLGKSVRASRQPKRVSICTDDGFACSYTGLLPLMQKYKLKPCLFLLGKCLDNAALAWNHKLQIMKRLVPASKLDERVRELLPESDFGTLFADLGRQSKEQITDALWQSCMPYAQAEYLHREQPFLSISQLQELVENGAELALHSNSHPDFSRLSVAEAEAELQANMAALDTRGLPYSKLFAYPYGRAMEASDEAILFQKLGLQATFGIRYAAGNNEKPYTRWQRQNLEASPYHNFLEFAFKPLYRKILSK